MTVRKRSSEVWRTDYAVHPGETVREMFKEMGLTGVAASERLGVKQSYISDILRGHRGLSSKMALRLETLGGPRAEFWVSLQAHYDLQVERLKGTS